MNPYAHMNYSQGVARFLDLFASNSQATAAAECVALHVPSGGSVLDIGAGTGGIGLAIAEAGYRVTMLEPDHEMFAMLLAALAARPGVQERVTPIPRPFGFDTGTAFDAVVCFAVVHLLSPEQRSELIACAARQVRPDGVVILEMPVATSQRVASAWQCVGRMPLGAPLWSTTHRNNRARRGGGIRIGDFASCWANRRLTRLNEASDGIRFNPTNPRA